MFGIGIRKSVKCFCETFKEDARWEIDVRLSSPESGHNVFKDSKSSALISEKPRVGYFKVFKTGIDGLTNRDIRYIKRMWNKYNNWM